MLSMTPTTSLIQQMTSASNSEVSYFATSNNQFCHIWYLGMGMSLSFKATILSWENYHTHDNIALTTPIPYSFRSMYKTRITWGCGLLEGWNIAWSVVGEIERRGSWFMYLEEVIWCLFMWKANYNLRTPSIPILKTLLKILSPIIVL